MSTREHYLETGAFSTFRGKQHLVIARDPGKDLEAQGFLGFMVAMVGRDRCSVSVRIVDDKTFAREVDRQLDAQFGDPQRRLADSAAAATPAAESVTKLGASPAEGTGEAS